MIKAINPDNNDNNIFVITQCILLLVYSFIPMIVEKKGNVEISEAMKILFIAFGIDSILIGEIFGAIQLLPGGIK